MDLGVMKTKKQTFINYLGKYDDRINGKRKREKERV